MASKTTGIVARRQMQQHKQWLESTALAEARAVLDDHNLSPHDRVVGARNILAEFSGPYGRLLKQEALDS